ncbi:hypothetical protein MIT9_P1889 [Methylomarinovum caldicuralii]|uniref:Heme-binding protein n=1 Tax=Methylomarinovum caldicuralii TaxID=438856 RepID=A0AAU9C3P0_9GAMM|nr:heme-binding protein [Methylomarinovum caldicuralii]BCX82303.1 hypothetical protein MIT9_P1889 [Methylomarinovum caldicuralii]
MKKWLLGLLGVAFFVNVEAVETVEQKTITLAGAIKAAQAAQRACQGKGYAVAVVDRSGQLLALLRDEQAGPHTIDSSWRKAYTALTLRHPTHKLVERVVKDPKIQALGDMNEKILLLGGGLPIVEAREVVGAIGVGGAPGAMLDVACARAGLRVLRGRD